MKKIHLKYENVRKRMTSEKKPIIIADFVSKEKGMSCERCHMITGRSVCNMVSVCLSLEYYSFVLDGTNKN